MHKQWIEFGIEKLLQSYPFFQLHSDFTTIRLDKMHIAVARFGGPIAILPNKFQTLSPLEYEQSEQINFFSNKGFLQSTVKIQYTQIIVAFDFLQDQRLIFFLNTGYYFLISPFRQTKRKYYVGDYGVISEARIFGKSAVFYANFRYYLVRNVYSPHVIQFVNPESRSNCPFEVLQSSKTFSKKIQIVYMDKQCKLYRLIEDQSKQAQPLPLQSNCRPISLSTNAAQLVVLFPSQIIYISSGQIYTFSLNKKYQLRVVQQKKKQVKYEQVKILWIQETSVVVTNRYLILVGIEGIKELDYDLKKYAFKQEVDGLRIISKHSSILRKVPTYYKHIFLKQLQHPSYTLFTLYQQYQKRQSITQPNFTQQQLEQAIEHCVLGVQFALNIQVQIKLLKVICFGRNRYLLKGEQHQVFQVCKMLRVINALRHQIPSRVLTLPQFKILLANLPLLLKLFLRYQLHYLADQCLKYLNLDQIYRKEIYLHWGCCKLESEQPDKEVLKQIEKKFKQIKGSMWVQLAQRAIEIGKKQLGLSILCNQDSLQKKVTILLWLASQQGNLQYLKESIGSVQSSQNGDVHQLLLRRFLPICQQPKQKLQLLKGYQNIQRYFIEYLKIRDLKGLQYVYKCWDKRQQIGMMWIAKGVQQQGQNRIKGLNNARIFLESTDIQFYHKTHVFKQQLYNQSKTYSKTYTLLKSIKHLIQEGNMEEVDRKLLESFPPGFPYYIIAQLLLQRQEQQRAKKWVVKMKGDRKYQLMCKMGMFKEAYQLARQKGNQVRMEQIKVKAKLLDVQLDGN